MRGRVRGAWAIGVVAVLGVGAVPVAAQGGEDAPRPREVVARALDLMGGEAVAGIQRVRLTMMTQWQRTDYRDVPWTDRPSFEPHTDVRDYTLPAWRNTREFGARNIVNVVVDSVAVTDMGTGFQPLSVAYVDERDELFVYTPDRLVLLLSGAGELGSAPDTVVGGERFHRVRATLAGVGQGGADLPVTVDFHAGSGLPARLVFRQGHPNDFGLVPFGEMWVEVRYSNWRSFGEVSLPTQWDIARAGAPYKRMTVRGAAINPELAADSFAVAPELRVAYLASVAPMHDRPVDSVTVAAPGLLQLHGFGFPAGALELDDGWLLLQAGHAPLSLERGRDALAARGMGRVRAALVAAATNGNGGVATLVEEGVPVFTSPAADPFLEVMLEGHGVRPRGITVVREPGWVEVGGTRLWMEPLDLPDTPGSILLYAPELGWVYAPDAVQPLDVRLVRDRARERGWEVRALGTPRGVWQEVGGAG